MNLHQSWRWYKKKGMSLMPAGIKLKLEHSLSPDLLCPENDTASLSLVPSIPRQSNNARPQPFISTSRRHRYKPTKKRSKA